MAMLSGILIATRSIDSTRVEDPVGVYPGLVSELTIERKPDPDPALKKNRIPIRPSKNNWG